ncbi:MAG TPA: MFS transporter [Methanothrix sp.]|nr:MFS transporter [Methanothrix sp.]HPJ84862.1 MFS transporter [Methanothrix sp.]HPR65937.1 MFS transporter [Methanothrix sp.]
MKVESGAGPGSQRLTIFTIALAAFMGSLDVTIVNISLPTISRYFDVGTGMVSWIVLAYLLVMSSFLLAFGKIGDLKGFKRVFLAGFAVFVAGSFLCAVAPSIKLLIAFRMLQALGAAMLTAIGPAMVTVFLPQEVRGKALGIVATFASLGIAMGPPIGGLLTSFLSWRWIFFINIPVGIVAILIGRLVLPEAGPRPGQKARFDLLGAALVFLTLFGLIFGMNMGQELGWTSPPITGSIIGSLVLAAVFIFRESRFSEPLVDLKLFRNGSFTSANGAVLLVMLVYGGAVFLFPFYLELVKGLGTDVAGLILMVPSVATMIVAPRAGALSDKIGSRKICVVATILCVAGFYLLSFLDAESSRAFIFVTLVILGLSLGMFLPPNSNLVMAQSPAEKCGIASSLMMTARNVGTVIGIAVFEMVFAARVQMAGISDGAVQGGASIAPLTLGFHDAFLVGAGFSVLAVILSVVARDVG